MAPRHAARPSRSRSTKQIVAECGMMEHLEGRTLFGASPFPSLDDMRDPNNTVVRIETRYGNIDIELYDSLAPNTVTNFLRYVREGHYDQSVFHRHAANFVLQGGGFRYDGLPGATPALTAVPQYDQINNEFDGNQRSNDQWTIAMAKLASPADGGPPNGGPNSATNQWFINLVDNTGALDGQNGGFTVFGQVLAGSSRTVVTTITGLPVPTGQTGDPRLNSVAPFNGPLFSGNFSSTPVDGTVVANLPEDNIPRMRDVEIIKARNVQTFYGEQFYYPEGFAGSTINEFLPIANPTQAQVFYQVIVRSEVTSGDISTTTGWFRDRVISTGSIGAHSRGGITISQFGAGGAPGIADLVPQGVPYSIEVRATGQLAPTLSHYDFGTSTGEAFTTTLDTTWGFAQAEKRNASVFDFLVWSNPNGVAADIQITFFFQSSAPVTLTATTDAYRRGGFAFQNIAQLPNNTFFSARIVSSVPIVAALSHFDNTGDQFGSTTLGIAGNGSEVGVVPGAIGGPGVSQVLSILNPNNTAAVVTIVLRFNDGAEVTIAPTQLIGQRSRVQVNLATNANSRVQAGDPFSIRYSTLPQGLAIYATSSTTALTDVATTPVATVASTISTFGEGFMDPARASINVFETISLYNPNSFFFNGTGNVTANVTLNFLYGDGFVLQHTFTVGGGARFELNIDEFQPVLAEATNNGRFYYSMQVVSDIPLLAQMFHYDLTLGGTQASGGFTTLGTQSGTIVRLDQI